MQVVRITHPREFLSRVEPLLLEDEVRNNLMLGLATTLIERPDRYREFRLWVVEDSARPVAAALQTPPWNLTVSGPARPEAVHALARAIHEERRSPPGATGAVPEVDVFAESWGGLTGTEPRVEMAQGIYRLTAVRLEPAAPGAMRDARPGERNLLVEWATAFVEEAIPGGPADPAGMIDSRLADNAGEGYVVWVEGEVVSLAGFGGRTPNGIRIGPVYTPPGFRNRGYASGLVAALSRRMLDEGRAFCFLYTDLANPTSNRIYQRIGYERACNSRVYRFDPQAL